MFFTLNDSLMISGNFPFGAPEYTLKGKEELKPFSPFDFVRTC